MKAMILAAGFGTRLRPLTDNCPKALVQVAGITMLERLIRRLTHFDIRDIIINVHHLSDQIEEFLHRHKNFDIHIELSHESEILGTGGGIRQAAYFFDDGQPFLVHNVDILTDLNLSDMLHFHESHQNMATLAVRHRTSSRHFLIDEKQQVCGHADHLKNIRRVVVPGAEPLHEIAFSGIHIISPKIFQHMPISGFFSIVDVYLKLAEQGYSVGVFQMDDYYWRDLGKVETIRAAEKDFIGDLIENPEKL
ncbi:nucleotidyltransferase family protein [candidate division KSB1 bacterium]|nr:nucleotidyltransferase family protein [candidate division KSB1 bacterium]